MKVTAYILIVALFLTSMGLSLFYFPELGAIRQNMQLQLEKNNNHIELDFTKKAYVQLDWTRKGKEFRYRGRMYDVASVKTMDKKVLVSCLFDKEETGLRQKLKDFFTPSSNKNLPLRQAVKVLSQKYFNTTFFSFPGLYNFRLLVCKPYLFSFCTFENSPDGPPPKVSSL